MSAKLRTRLFCVFFASVGYSFGHSAGVRHERARQPEAGTGFLYWANEDHTWDRVRVGDPDHFLRWGGDVVVAGVNDSFGPVSTEKYDTSAGHVWLDHWRPLTSEERRALELATLRSNGCFGMGR